MSYEVARCFQRYHAEKLNKKVDEYETVLRKIYKIYNQVVVSRNVPDRISDRVFGYDEVIPLDDVIDQYVSEYRRKINEYEEDWKNVDMSNLMEEAIDSNFPIHYVNDLQLLLGFRIFTRRISLSTVMYLVYCGERFVEFCDDDPDGKFLPFKGAFEVFLWSEGLVPRLFGIGGFE